MQLVRRLAALLRLQRFDLHPVEGVAEDRHAGEENGEIADLQREQPARREEVELAIGREEDAGGADGDRAGQKQQLMPGTGVLKGDELAVEVFFAPAAPQRDDDRAQPRHHQEQR